MTNIEFFDDLKSYFFTFSFFFLHHLAIFLLNLAAYAYVLIRFFKVFCYSKLTFEWFPMLNPYVWPFSFFQSLTEPYFEFWSRVLPNIALEKSTFEVSSIIALESLNTCVYFLMLLTDLLVGYLTTIDPLAN